MVVYYYLAPNHLLVFWLSSPIALQALGGIAACRLLLDACALQGSSRRDWPGPNEPGPEALPAGRAQADVRCPGTELSGETSNVYGYCTCPPNAGHAPFPIG